MYTIMICIICRLPRSSLQRSKLFQDATQEGSGAVCTKRARAGNTERTTRCRIASSVEAFREHASAVEKWRSREAER